MQLAITVQMQEFSKQNAKMDMASELMDDAMEDMFEVDEGEADDLVNQVLPLCVLRNDLCGFNGAEQTRHVRWNAIRPPRKPKR